MTTPNNGGAALAELIAASKQYRSDYRSEGCPLPDCKLCARSNAAGHRCIRDLLAFTEHCLSASDEGVDYAVPREWLDAMTTLGLLEKTGRGLWAPTEAAKEFVRRSTTPPTPRGSRG